MEAAGAVVSQQKPFRFLDLPAELRLRIYELVLLRREAVDLDAENAKTIAPILKLFLASRQIHEEAYPVFYGGNTFRIFAATYRFFGCKTHLPARLPLHYRSRITKLELRLGPGWTNPPHTWNVLRKHQLHTCANARLLKIFIELDPSQDAIMRAFMPAEDSYTRFSVDLFHKVLGKLPNVQTVEFDARPSVSKDGGLMAALLREAKNAGRKIAYGPEHGWTVSGASTPMRQHINGVQDSLVARGLVNALAAVTVPVVMAQA